MNFSKIAAAVTGVTLAATLAACGSSTNTADKTAAAGGGSTAGSLVGVTMPTRSSERWIQDGDNVKAGLEKLGYKVDLEYANNDIPTQATRSRTRSRWAPRSSSSPRSTAPR